jgi:hypothetical protein
VLQDR